MIIGIDGNEANIAVRVGIGEYAYELLKHFHDIGVTIQDVRFHIYLKDQPRDDMPKASHNWKYIVVKPHKLWTQIGLPLYLFTHFPRPDVFFTPSHYAPRFSPVPTVISIMDLSYVRFPELFAQHDLYQLTHWTKYSAKHAAKIFTISNASKNDIITEYKKRQEDVVVTYPGIRNELSNMQDALSKKELQEKYKISSNYILFVGTLQPRKNITRLIEAFSKVKALASQKDLQLAVVGKKGWLYAEILAAPKKYGVADSVKFLDFVSTEDLPALYENALCYVLPSLYEGFGLPVLEAMKYGCPVITSNVSSLPEAGGDAALYVNPESVDDIAQKIQQVISDEKLRSDMKAKGLMHIKQFSWEKTAKETLDVLQSVTK